MQHLSLALKSYYTKKSGKIIFSNGSSLNQLAMMMWEYLNYSQVDASVLSKVVNGKRLFTPLQLESFCKILGLSQKEHSYLLFCLNKDFCNRYNIELDNYYLPKEEVLALLKQCINEVFTVEHKNELAIATRLPHIIETFTKDIAGTSMDIAYEKTVFEILGASLYFKAKRLINFKHGSLYIAENDMLSKVYASSPILHQVVPRKAGTTMSVYREKKASSFSADYIVGIHPELSKLNIGSDLVVPLTYKNKTFGVLSMLSHADEKFTTKDIKTLQNYL